MRILFTGASSFTGMWFVRALASAGHDVVTALRRSPHDYNALRASRLEQLRERVELVPGAPFGSPPFTQLLNKQNFDLLCHHGADTTNYKSPDFDTEAAVTQNTNNLEKVFKRFQGRHVLLTGTVFEANEGQGTLPLRAFSPYGESKSQTFEIFQAACAQHEKVLGKFVIPNPFGPFEEPKFTAYLMREWLAQRTPTLDFPDYVRDNIHVDLLARAYRAFAERLAKSETPLRHNPSGYAEPLGDFVQRMARETRTRTGLPCAVEILKQTEFPEPRVRTNTEVLEPEMLEFDESEAWSHYVAHAQSSAVQRH